MADRFAAKADDALADPILAITVSAGPGSDVVKLVDRTARDQPGFPGSGADRVSCGSGRDEVVTTSATEVAADCEKVTTIE